MDQKYKFFGEFDHTLDPKGRIIIPAKYRDPLGNKVYLAKNWDKACVNLYPADEWERIMSRHLANISPFDSGGQEFRRSLASDVEDAEVDKQGRVFISQKLRAHAGIDSAVTIIGVLDRLEIWNTGRWNLEKSERPVGDLARHMRPNVNDARPGPS